MNNIIQYYSTIFLPFKQRLLFRIWNKPLISVRPLELVIGNIVIVIGFKKVRFPVCFILLFISGNKFGYSITFI